jgi:hypothetical protein
MVTYSHRYRVIRDGRLYDSNKSLEAAIQHTRSWQAQYGGVWKVLDSKNGRKEYSIGPTTVTPCKHS